MEKIYKVEFMSYTNRSKDTVSNQSECNDEYAYVIVGKEPFLVRESELEKYRGYGGGFRSIEFVGNIII